MLAGFGGADGVLAVHGVGQADVDRVDLGVVADAVEGLVGVDGLRRDVVLRGIAFALVGWVSRDEARDFGALRLRAGCHEDVGDDAKANRGVADALYGLRGQSGRGECHGGELSEVAAVEGGCGHANTVLRRFPSLNAGKSGWESECAARLEDAGGRAIAATWTARC